MKKGLKIAVLSVILFVFSYSLIFEAFQEQIQDKLFFKYGFVVDKKLNGVFTYLAPKELSFKSWFDGSFQENRNGFIEENIAFRNWLVKLKNQIHFSFFKESGNKTVVVGKDNVLFEKRYLDSYIGKDYLGEKEVYKRTKQLEAVQAKLQKMGKQLLVILAPSKPHLFSDKLPIEFAPQPTVNTNYKAFKIAISKSSINTIDINEWMLKIADTCRYTLIPQNGAHWSNYFACVAGDSIIRKMESLSQKPMRHCSIEKLNISTVAGASEDDLLFIMNLVKPLPNKPLADPLLKFYGDSTSFKPNVIAIADSYYWNLIFMNIPLEVFDFESQYWYYNKKVFTFKVADEDISKIDFKSSIKEADVVLIIATEPNLVEFPYGFENQFNNNY